MRGMLDQMFGGLRPVSDEDFDTIRDYQNPLYGADQYLEEGARKSSVFTFKGGLGELGDRLEERLEEAPNVSLCKNTFVTDLKLNFQTEGSKVRLIDHNVIAARFFPRSLLRACTLRGFTVADLKAD